MLDYKPREELIALIQRQESELAKSHDENETLKAEREALTLELAARQPLADSFVAPSVTVDTPEFKAYLSNWVRASNNNRPYNVVRDYRDVFIAYIDQHTARAVAAERQRMEAKWAEHEATQHDLQEAIQPVAGELPPLPAYGWVLPGNYTDSFEKGAENPWMASAGAFPVFRAAQPVQQPAAGKDQEVLALHRKLAAETLRANQGWQRYEEANQDRNSLRAERTGPAADVQCDVLLRTVTELAKCIWRDNYRADAPQWEPLPDVMGVLSQIDNMVCGMRRAAVDKFSQPDSGRDAALAVAVLRDSLQDARNAFGNILNNVETGYVRRICTAQMQSIYADLAKALLLAAHPAPSSDAVLTDNEIRLAIALGEVQGTLRCIYTVSKESFVAKKALEAYAKIESSLAAHPANRPQAGDATQLQALQLARVHLDWSLDGDEFRKIASTIDVAILAAAKKGANNG